MQVAMLHAGDISAGHVVGHGVVCAKSFGTDTAHLFGPDTAYMHAVSHAVQRSSEGPELWWEVSGGQHPARPASAAGE